MDAEATSERCRCHVFFSGGPQECETCGTPSGLANRSGPSLLARAATPEPRLSTEQTSAHLTPGYLDLEDELDDDAGR